MWPGPAASGSYAEKAVVPADQLVKIPDGVTAKQAAAAMLQGMTAHYLAISTYPLKPGDTCLVHAGAGGVGLLLTQIAKMRGARVLTTVSTDEKAQLSREAGADVVIDYTKEDFEAVAKRETGGRGVQVVYDSVGKTTFDKGLVGARAPGHDGALRPVERAGRGVRSADPLPARIALPDPALALQRVHRRPRGAPPAPATSWAGCARGN